MITTLERSLCPDLARSMAAVFRADVLRGLRDAPKNLPCKYFYDEAGSDLFEQITRLDEYYPTRTERAIMEQHAGQMARLLGRRCLLVEYGSGSSAKTRLLLDHMSDPSGYVGVDVSVEHLRRSIRRLAADYPNLHVRPLCADFTRRLVLPACRKPVARRVVYFPGSTLGNFTPHETLALLRQTARRCREGGGLLLGIDLRKDPSIIEAAYNDRRGVTAAFNRNLLVRINRELGANFVVGNFAHRAIYNEEHARVEMHLVSRCRQRVHVGTEEFDLAPDESIRTEYSYKFDLDELCGLAAEAGFEHERSWTDPQEYFAVLYFTVR